MPERPWTTEDIPNLKDKTAVVTGANSGLGYHASLELARKGAHVSMARPKEETGRGGKRY